MQKYLYRDRRCIFLDLVKMIRQILQSKGLSQLWPHDVPVLLSILRTLITARIGGGGHFVLGEHCPVQTLKAMTQFVQVNIFVFWMQI